jgi:hypothetical protein
MHPENPENKGPKLIKKDRVIIITTPILGLKKSEDYDFEFGETVFFPISTEQLNEMMEKIYNAKPGDTLTMVLRRI